MSMLLFVLHELWSIIDDSGFVVSSVVSSHPALLSFHMLAGNLDRAPGLLVVGDMAEVHYTGQGPGKAGRDEFPSADKALHKVAMDSFVGPFAPSHPPPL
jgi:hypothetical protein